MRVAVIGAGIAGLATALALSRLTVVDVVILESHAEITPGIGFAVNLAPNGMRVLGRMGLAEQVTERGTIINKWVTRHSDGELITEFPLHFDSDYGSPMVTIRRDLLLDVLLDAVVEAGIDVRFNCAVRGLLQDADGVRLRLSDGDHLYADAAAACDGIHSPSRTELLGSPLVTLNGQVQSFGISHPEAPSALLHNTFATTLGIDSYFGGYGIGHGEVLWFVGYNRTPHPSANGELPDPSTTFPLEFVSELTRGWHSPVPELIDTTVRYGALNVRHQAPPASLCAGRVALLGDAAHPVQLHFGQGACLALEDAMTFAMLTARGSSETINENTLAAYDRIRRPRRIAVGDFSRQMGRRFHWTNPLRRRIRNLVLQRLGPKLIDDAAWIYAYAAGDETR